MSLVPSDAQDRLELSGHVLDRDNWSLQAACRQLILTWTLVLVWSASYKNTKLQANAAAA